MIALGIRAAAGLLLCATLAGAAPAPMPHDWCVLAVEEDGGKLTIVDPATARHTSLPIGEKPHEIEVNRERDRAFVTQFGVRDYDLRLGTPGDHVAVIDLKLGRKVAEWLLPTTSDGAQPRGPHGVKLRPPAEHELFVNSEVGVERMIVFDTQTGKVRRSFPVPAGTHNFIFSADGRRLYAFAGAAGAFRLDPETGKVLAGQHAISPVRGLGWSEDGSAILAGGHGEVAFLSPEDLHVIRRVLVPGAGQIFYLLASAGQVFAPGGPNGKVSVIRTSDGALLRAIETGKTPIAARRGPDDKIYVANVQDDHLSVIDPAGFAQSRISGLAGPNGLAFGRCPARW